jgi:hypothetical protein
MGERQAEVRGLERQLRSAQERLDQIRQQHPELLLGNGTASQPRSAEAEAKADVPFQ